MSYLTVRFTHKYFMPQKNNEFFQMQMREYDLKLNRINIEQSMTYNNN